MLLVLPGAVLVSIGIFALYHGMPAYLGSPRSKKVSELDPRAAISIGLGLMAVGVYANQLRRWLPAINLQQTKPSEVVPLTGASRLLPHLYAAILTLSLLGYLIYSQMRGTSDYTPGFALGLVSFALVYLWNWLTAHAIGWTFRRANDLPPLGKWCALLAGSLPSLAFAGLTVAEHLQINRDVGNLFASLTIFAPLIYGLCFMPVYYFAKGIQRLGGRLNQ